MCEPRTPVDVVVSSAHAGTHLGTQVVRTVGGDGTSDRATTTKLSAEQAGFGIDISR